MIKFVIRLATLLALCNAAQSFFSVTPIMKSNYKMNHLNHLTFRCNNKGYGESDNSSYVPILRPKPIPVISFDDLFLNWNNVNRVFLSEDCDRIILLYGNDKKGVYYIEPDQHTKIEYMLSITSAIVTIEAVCNLDNPWFHLYCSPRGTKKELGNKKFNITKSQDDNNDKDDINDDYGFDFGLGM